MSSTSLEQQKHPNKSTSVCEQLINPRCMSADVNRNARYTATSSVTTTTVTVRPEDNKSVIQFQAASGADLCLGAVQLPAIAGSKYMKVQLHLYGQAAFTSQFRITPYTGESLIGLLSPDIEIGTPALPRTASTSTNIILNTSGVAIMELYNTGLHWSIMGILSSTATVTYV